jgi:mono/diheme cytochrome c family protein
MIRKILKWTGIVIGLLVVAVTLLFTKAYFSVNNKLKKKYDYVLQELSINPDSAMLAEGARLIVAKGCTDCHGADLGGKVFIDDVGLGKVTAKNITKGKGGLTAGYNEKDWLRALKHGLNADSTSLRVMPSYEFTHFSEDDTKALIAYGMQLKPVDRELPPTSFKPLAYVLTELDILPVIVAEKIDHAQPLTKIQPEISLAYGKHISAGCVGCHKDNLKGGDPVIPGSPQVADITSAGNIGRWSEEQFVSTLRTGKTPEGKELPVEFMPWSATKNYTDTELKALYMYLKSI